MRVLCTMIVFIGAMGMSTIGRAQNSCVTCHATLPAAQQKVHSYADWSQSTHARAGVTCEQCHGGNATQDDRAAAHRGMLPSSQTQSPVYFTQLPQTCGACHTAELSAFKESYHYKELQRSGRGPNCVTCHGAMATHVLKSQQMEQTCALCHTKPTAAGQALVTLNQAGALLKAWEGRAPHSEGLAQARRKYAAIQRKWHAFKMADVLREAQALVQMARQATDTVVPQGTP